MMVFMHSDRLMIFMHSDTLLMIYRLYIHTFVYLEMDININLTSFVRNLRIIITFIRTKWTIIL